MSDKPQSAAEHPEQLGRLYPTPKTYDELEQERERIAALRLSWLPKHPWLDSIGILFLVAASGYAIVRYVFPVAIISPMFGVFASIFAILCWLAGCILGLRRVVQLLRQPRIH